MRPVDRDGCWRSQRPSRPRRLQSSRSPAEVIRHPKPPGTVEVPVSRAGGGGGTSCTSASGIGLLAIPSRSVPCATDAYEVDAAIMAKARLAVAEKFAPKLATDIQPIEIVAERRRWVLLSQLFSTLGSYAITSESMTPDIFLIERSVTDSGWMVVLRGKSVGQGTIRLVASDDHGRTASVSVAVYVLWRSLPPLTNGTASPSSTCRGKVIHGSH